MVKKFPYIFPVLGIIVFMLIFINLPESEYFFEPEAETKTLKIAACPTCFGKAKYLNPEKYQIISTLSTAESAALLAEGEVDMILAGRTLKSHETVNDSLILANGFSFLSGKPLTLYTNELKNAIIYTDIDFKEINQELPDFVFEKVDDVYQYLEKGIVMTSWDNTDYERAEIVHIIEDNGERLAISRRPTLYCPTDCDKEIGDEIRSVFD